jgi:thioredoxin reductase (NADPH)
MLTADDVRAIPLFATLSGPDLERLAGSAADVYLCTGEFAVHEGGERALYAVIAGKIEVLKLIDGIERTLGWRGPGAIFGEVPLTLGTPFPGAYRASLPSRVMRIDAQQYYALAATALDISLKVSALARERIGGLQGLAAEAPKPRVTVFGQQWNNASADLRRFLARNQIPYEWVMPDSPDLAKQWPAERPVDAECPALLLSDGTVLTRANARHIAERLGLQTRPGIGNYDTVVIGGGPAGLAAAVYGASEGLRTLVVEREAPGGQAGTSSRIENYLGFPNGVSGDELASRALRQARRLGAEILVTRSVSRIDPLTRRVFLDGNETVEARTILLATGVNWRRLTIEGFERLVGKGIYYGAARSEANTTYGQDIHLIGAGNSAGQAALFFANHARKVTLVVRGDAVEHSMSHYLIEQLRGHSNVDFRLNSEVVGVQGDAHLTAVDIINRTSNEKRRENCGGLFVFIGADAETQWRPAEIARDSRGYVLTGNDVAKAGRWVQRRDPYLLETSVPGIFACGDVRLSPVTRVAAAGGDGSMAIAFVHQYLRHEGRLTQPDSTRI